MLLKERFNVPLAVLLEAGGVVLRERNNTARCAVLLEAGGVE